MEPEQTFLQKYRFTLILLAIVVLLGAVLLCMIWQRQLPQGQVTDYQATNEAIESISEPIITEESVASNPVEDKIPELNPVDKTNPYASYKNPFE
jgi:hypothetical protein